MPKRPHSNFGSSSSRRSIEVRERAAKALKMRRAGYTPREIAERIPEYKDEKQVRVDLRKVLSELIDQPAKEMIALQFHRYERLILSIWRDAIAGDVAAHDRIIKHIEGQNKLLRLGSMGEEGSSEVDRWLSSLLGTISEAESGDVTDHVPDDDS